MPSSPRVSIPSMGEGSGTVGGEEVAVRVALKPVLSLKKLLLLPKPTTKSILSPRATDKLVEKDLLLEFPKPFTKSLNSKVPLYRT